MMRVRNKDRKIWVEGISIFPGDEGGRTWKTPKNVETEIAKSSTVGYSLVREEPCPRIFSEEFVDENSVDFFELVSLKIFRRLLEGLSHSLDGVEVEFFDEVIEVLEVDVIETADVLNVSRVGGDVVSEGVSENFGDVFCFEQIFLSIRFSLDFFILDRLWLRFDFYFLLLLVLDIFIVVMHIDLLYLLFVLFLAVVFDTGYVMRHSHGVNIFVLVLVLEFEGLGSHIFLLVLIWELEIDYLVIEEVFSIKEIIIFIIFIIIKE